MKFLTMLGKSIPYSFKFDLKMKLTVYLFLITLFQIHANSYSQNTKITLELNNVSIENVLQTIENQSEFKFLYNDKDVDYKKQVSVKFKKTKIFKILEDLFSNTNINYEVLDKQIVLVLDLEKSKTTLEENDIQKAITGTVVDDTGVPVPGANILVKGTTNGVVSDFDGNFTINASSSDVLVISYLGFVIQEISVGTKSTISVELLPDAEQLEDVVVIGYGTVKKKDLTGSVSRVTTESFEKQPLTRVEDALQGRAAGVSVARANGQPGGGIKIRIRGVNSITGDNSPLVVIDGIQGGDLSTLNPNDIAAMDVLKDASATAIYGVRGSNGVIIVTTKKGSGKGKFNVDYFTTFSQVPDLLPTLQTNAADFARIENLRRINVGGSANYSDSEIADLEANGGTNYQDALFRTGVSENLQMSASGSEGKLRYFISGNYRDEEGIIINTGYQQLSLRSNIEAQVNDRLKVNLNIYGSWSDAKNDLSLYGNGQGSLISKALTWDPTTPIRNSNGEFNILSNKSVASLNDNPIRTISLSDGSTVEEELNAALTANYKITDNFSYTINAGSSINNITTQFYNVETSNRIPDARFSNNKSHYYQISNIFTWQKNFNDQHDIKLTGVQEYSNTKNYSNGYDARGIALPKGFYLAELAPVAGQSINNNFGERELSSFMLRTEYIFNDDLFITATGRYDGTSVFRPGNKWGFFPSLALAYNLGDLVEESNFISSLKFRAGWGQVGNQNIGNLGTFGGLRNDTYSFDFNSTEGGLVLNRYDAADVTWETTSQFNAGIDVGFNNGRGNFSIDGYIKKTEDLLLLVPVPGTFGAQSQFARDILNNVGEVENIGFDFSLSYNIIDTDDLQWDTGFSLSYVKNEVTKLYGGLDEIRGQYRAPGGQSRTINFIEVGESLGQFDGATFLGTWKSSEAAAAATFDKAPGDAKYLRDENGEIVFGAIGNGTPNLFWGLNNTFTYKKWDLNVFLQGVHGFDVYNITQAMITGGAGDSRSFLAADQVNQWTPTNETDIPATVQFYNSSRYVEKGDFIRLSNLSLGYTFSDFSWLKNSTIKIYASGQNLFLITDYSGYDPELSSRRNGQGNEDVAPGINVGAYPNPRTYSFGIKVGF